MLLVSVYGRSMRLPQDIQQGPTPAGPPQTSLEELCPSSDPTDIVLGSTRPSTGLRKCPHNRNPDHDISRDYPRTFRCYAVGWCKNNPGLPPSRYLEIVNNDPGINKRAARHPRGEELLLNKRSYTARAQQQEPFPSSARSQVGVHHRPAQRSLRPDPAKAAWLTLVETLRACNGMDIAKMILPIRPCTPRS